MLVLEGCALEAHCGVKEVDLCSIVSCACTQFSHGNRLHPCLQEAFTHVSGSTCHTLQGLTRLDRVCQSLYRIQRARVQAPLLAYNHFVEALFVLNDCRAGLQQTCAAWGPSQGGPESLSQGDAGAETLSQVVGAPGGPGSLAGPSPQARGKRDAVYRRGPCDACLTPHGPLMSPSCFLQVCGAECLWRALCVNPLRTTQLILASPR